MSGLPSSAAGRPEAEDGSLRSVPLLCQALAPGPARDAAVLLLSGGGGSAAQIRTRCQAGAVYALVDVAAEPGDPPPAAAVLVAHGDGGMELSDLIAPGPNESDLTVRLLAELCDALRRSDVRRLVVDTPGPRFRPSSSWSRPAFGPAAVENGRDWFELRL